MKNLSIKKLAAIAAGAVLVGTALAPAVSALSLTNSDVYDTTTGAPAVDVVVGSLANIEDVVWAGNIATAIAAHAYTTGDVVCSGDAACGDATPEFSDLSVDLTVGGTVSYANAWTYKAGETSGTTSLNSYATTAGNHEFSHQMLSYSKLPHLYYKQTTIKWSGTNYSRTYQEYIGVDGDADFDYQNSYIQDLEMYMANEYDFNYIINLGTKGIPCVEDPTSNGADFADGTNDNIRIPFFGEEYLVRSVDCNSGTEQIKLIKESAKETFAEGSVVEGLTGNNNYAGQTMSVKIAAIVQTGATTAYTGRFELYDEEGNLVDTRTAAAAESLDELFVDEDGDYALQSIFYIETITLGSTSGEGSVEVLKGTNMVDLYHNKIYPYDSAFVGTPDWKVNIAKSTDNPPYVTSITIGNAGRTWENSSADPPMYAPEAQALTSEGQAGSSTAIFLDGAAEDTAGYKYVELDFRGFEDDEALSTIEYANNEIKYTDASGYAHVIPMWISLTADTSGSSFTFDETQTIYYVSEQDDMTFDFNAAASSVINGVSAIQQVHCCTDDNCMGYPSNIFDADANCSITFKGGDRRDLDYAESFDLNGVTYTLADGNISGDVNVVQLTVDGNVTFAKASFDKDSPLSDTSDYLEQAASGSYGAFTRFFRDGDTDINGVFNGNPITLVGKGDAEFQYALYSHSTYNHIYLLLDTTTDFGVQYRGDIKFYGTDVDEGWYVDGTTDRSYYWPDEIEFGGAADNTYYVALLGIDVNCQTSHTYDVNLVIDTATDKLLALPNNNMNYKYDANVVTGQVAFRMDEDAATTTQPASAYTDFGTKIVLDSGAAKIQIPENQTRAVLIVKGEGVTEEVTGGEAQTVAEGDTWTTDTGTKITVNAVTIGQKSCVAGEGEATGDCEPTPSSYMMPADVGNLVVLDIYAGVGRHVIVGGPVVNELARAVDGLSDRLLASGDYVSEVIDGDIVVAGYRMADTATAAQALISAIDNL